MISEAVKAYVSSLSDLTFNSKPLINMLTMLADENVAHAAEIVEAVENHLAKVKTDVKLPILYLIDCILKNVGGPYMELFSRNIVATFCSVFRLVDEKSRSKMFKLRQTWNEVFSPKILYAIDVQLRLLDPAWPVTAPLPNSRIDLDPKSLKTTAYVPTSVKAPVAVPASTANHVTLDMQQQLIQKQKELLELQQKKLVLELLQTKVKLEEQIKGGTVPQVVPQVKNIIQVTGSINSGPKIQPANSALVAGAVIRPTRDPRLLKQQTHPPQITSNDNVQLESNNNLESSNNKIVNNKASDRDIQNDPRIENDNTVPSQKFTDVDNKSKSKVCPKKSEKNNTKSSSSSTSSRSKSHTDDSKSSKSSSSSSSSPKKSASSRSRRRDDRKSKSSRSRSREPKVSKSDTSLPVFKDAKNSRNRNYIRRNRSPQFSPELEDVDLRRLPNGKKRNSDSPDHNSNKRNKTFNVLFGNEDTDLRKLQSTSVNRPPTPPPPIISLIKETSTEKGPLTQKSDLEAVRAKLAATVKRISPKSLKRKAEDEDLRSARRNSDLGPPPPINPWLHQQQSLIQPVHNFIRKSPDSEIIVEPCSQEDIRKITIDGLPRDIRYYGEVAVIFLNWDDPRVISFQDGTRRVIFNDTDIYAMNFNEPYKYCRIGENVHTVRLGGPSREIFIDFKPYECCFDGPEIIIDLGGRLTKVKLDGPPPQVKISDERTNLVGGIVTLIIDAQTIVPIFVDATIQTFILNGNVHTLQLLPGLEGALINNEHFDVQFGGLPKPIYLSDRRHYIRFTVLPKEIKPGCVRIKGLENEEFLIASPKTSDGSRDIIEPALAIPHPLSMPYDPSMSPDNSSSGTIFQNVLQQQNLNNSDFLTFDPPVNNTSSYQVENHHSAQKSENVSNPSASSFNLNSINDLFQKLVASGIVTTNVAPAIPAADTPAKERSNVPVMNHPKDKPKKSKKFPPLKYVSFAKPEQLRTRQGSLYEKLYSGMQCSSCGTRFSHEQSIHYSQHLDWHFRQNRKGKKNARVATSRKWYYSANDWQNYEEIENLEEREKNFFDQQQQQDEGVSNAVVEDSELPSVNADPELQDICEVCGDKFEIFFNEDKEEWQFKNAMRDGDKIFHPICYEEHQQSLLNEETKEKEIDSTRIPGIEIVLDDDEEPEKSAEIVNEVVLDESDESKLNSGDKKEEDQHPETSKYEDEDDDVIIQEKSIEQIVLDDDDEKMDVAEETTQMSSESSSHAASLKTADQSEMIDDDGFVDINEGLIILKNFGEVKVKTEPIDEGENGQIDNLFENSIPDEQQMAGDVQEGQPKEKEMEVDQSQQPPASLVPSIDANHEMDKLNPEPAVSVNGKIKINILKPLPVISPRNSNKDLSSESDKLPKNVIDSSQPLPPGEEPISLKLKPALQGVELKQMPPVSNGSELTGMCSIM